MLRDALRKILERSGFSVHVGKDGGEALRIAREHLDRIDLLISDVQMPGMIGTELATMLRFSKTDLKVLFISAYPRRTVTLDPCWNFLQKPFLSKVFVEKIHKILGDPCGQ